jgi:hypothetical protein
VPIDGLTTYLAGNVNRISLGDGWDGEMDVQITSREYDHERTTLAFAITTDPNDALMNNHDAFLGLADPNVDVGQFVNDNVEGWIMHSWGEEYIPPGETNNLTDHMNPITFDPAESYYAFVAGASAVQTRVSVSFDISDGQVVQPVPLPAAVWLFGAGLFGLLSLTRRKLG